MGYDKWFGLGKLGFCLILVGFDDIDKVKFWRKSVDESAIGFAAFSVHQISFKYPLYIKTMDNRYILYILFR